MFQIIKSSINFVQNMGWRYVFFRGKHEIMLRTGLFRSKFPVDAVQHHVPSLQQWRESGAQFFFGDKNEIRTPKDRDCHLQKRYSDLLNGRYVFFGNASVYLGKNYNWVTNYETGYVYDKNKHWTEIADFSSEAGDIKYVWEKSRFTFLYDILRYDYHFDHDCSEHVLTEILSWIDSNPVNCGPNYRCSQEITLRVFNWIFALNYYKNRPQLTDDIFRKIINSIYWQIKHVHSNIDFSRIAVRNNHAITETLGLYIVGMLFPSFPEAGRWMRDGKRWFEQEVAYQVYEDGTFLQFSMNYHRVVIQLLTWAIRLSELNHQRLNKIVYDRASASLRFLHNCMNIPDGYLPNYGANDGALFFPLNNNDFRDFRPQLNALSAVLGTGLIGDYTEDQYWYGVNHTSDEIFKQDMGMLSYPVGGYYLLREKSSFTFIRCGKHKDRPSHADNLHVDVWVNGKNILRDSGSYKYNADRQYQEYFTGTMSHNTVVVDERSQMLKGSRFIWYFWTQAKSARWNETEDEYSFIGKISAYRYLNPKAVHVRTVTKKKGKLEWTITDRIESLTQFIKKQVWHHDENDVQFSALADGNEEAVKKECLSYNSLYYGEKTEGEAIGFLFQSGISTTIRVAQQA
jgi:hypothetical protein